MSTYTKPIIAITLLIAVSSLAQAKNSTQNKDGAHQRPTFESIDTNTDGDVDFDEFSVQKLPHGDHQMVFTSIDTNNNGVISQEEFEIHKPPHERNKKGNRND